MRGWQKLQIALRGMTVLQVAMAKLHKKSQTSLIEGYTADFLEKKAEQGQQHICRTTSDTHVMVPEIPSV